MVSTIIKIICAVIILNLFGNGNIIAGAVMLAAADSVVSAVTMIIGLLSDERLGMFIEALIASKPYLETIITIVCFVALSVCYHKISYSGGRAGQLKLFLFWVFNALLILCHNYVQMAWLLISELWLS